MRRTTFSRVSHAFRFAVVAAAALTAGCSADSLVDSGKLPADVTDPSSIATRAGALGSYSDAVLAFSSTVAQGQPNTDSLTGLGPTAQSVTVASALITDEAAFHADLFSVILGQVSPYPTSASAILDSRTTYDNAGLLESSNGSHPYLGLQAVRMRSREARGALRAYAPDIPQAVLGNLYAMQGMAEVMLAELYCSGIPLSDFNFKAEPTYGIPLTNAQVYQHAIAQFDTAIALSADSARILNFARIGRGRALLELGDFSAAAQAVAEVPTTFKYDVAYAATRPNFMFSGSLVPIAVEESNIEAGTGLRFVGDPRSDTAMTVGVFNEGIPGPKKYVPAGLAPAATGYINPGTMSVTVASGVEARLIEAEADLKGGGSAWLSILNGLRGDGTVQNTYTRQCLPGISGTGAQTGSPCPAGKIDTTWSPGSGVGLLGPAVLADLGPVCPTSATPGTACTDTVWYRGLRPLADPGLGAIPTGMTAADVRLDLVFAERAYWLFFTGHRQGDLRRLIRVYGRAPDAVYPTGQWPKGGVPYGQATSLPVPNSERLNPNFHGCINNDA